MKHHGTGLHDAGIINGRQAEPWELEVQARVYAQQRAKDAEQVNIPPSASGVNAMWADIATTFARTGAAK